VASTSSASAPTASAAGTAAGTDSH
jgi:hypothetical protein